LQAATPDGIDVDFENVGGEVMEAVLARLNVRARVALCGLISTYNGDAPAVSAGPRNFGNRLIQRVHLEGFIVLDHLGRAPEVFAQLAEWMAQDKLTALETVVEGFEQLPVAINMLFDGQHTGKLVVKL
jgi:NADPH-dependent curcumin reductase CurA